MKSKICGIYCIENLLNHKKYIGQSVNIYARWSGHKSELRHNTHSNTYIQSSWNKYGEENFKFYILELCLPRQLDSRERWNIKYFKTYLRKYGYNLDMGGQSIRDIMPYQRYKISITHKGKYVNENTRQLLSNIHSKSVVCLNNNQIFKSRTEAAIAYNTSPTVISDICSGKNLYYRYNGEYLQFCDYQDYINKNYKYIQSEDIITSGSKPIYQFDLSGNYIAKYHSVAECARMLDFQHSSLANCIRNKRQYKNYDYWFVTQDEVIYQDNTYYIQNISNYKLNQHPIQKIVQYDTNHNIINIYMGVTETARLFNITRGKLRSIIKSHKEFLGYYWEIE